jgi:hypothetical protein
MMLQPVSGSIVTTDDYDEYERFGQSLTELRLEYSLFLFEHMVVTKDKGSSIVITVDVGLAVAFSLSLSLSLSLTHTQRTAFCSIILMPPATKLMTNSFSTLLAMLILLVVYLALH